MSISKDTFVLFLLFIIYIGGDVYTARQTHNKLETYIKENSEWSMGSIWKTSNLEKRIDSLKLENQALAKTVLYLDSCQQVKTQKGERAERRGKFVGGLLRGLFPNM